MAEKLEWSHFIKTVADFTGVETSEINEKTNLYSDLGLDSLGLFSLGMHLIKTYHLKIPLAAVATIETVYDIYRLMKDSGASQENMPEELEN
ncbi:MAG TPA: acyl carrier protein [Bacillota bacterium]|nr:acyl carrier protein [Bacillota bacterium]